MKLRKFVPEFVVLIYAILFLLTKNPTNQWDRVIASDGKGYYAYLTALFIYNDTDYSFIDTYEAEYYPPGKPLYKDFRYNTGHGIVNKYFQGPAILWLPFFGVGHLVASVSGYEMDGYSLPYQMAIAFAAFFYLWLALLLLRKTLRFYTHNENTIAWIIVATALATNLIYYTVNAGSQVHVFNFFLINAFVYSILAAIRSQKASYYASAAFMLGMIIISRPQNGLIVFAIPFLCGSRKAFLNLIKSIFTNKRILLFSSASLLLPLLIPVSYWYYKTGQLLVYSYGNETYDLTNPHLLNFLFSFEKGWLLYTPLCAFALFGFVYLFRKNKWEFVSLSAFLFFLVYFMSSWWIWTYTSYIGQRVMIDYYIFAAILLVYVSHWFEMRGKKHVLPLIISLFVALNVMQYFQQLNWIYPAGPVTAKSYFSNFFSFDKGTTFMIPENEISNKQVYSTDFEEDTTQFATSEFSYSSLAHTGKRVVTLESRSNEKLLFTKGLSNIQNKNPYILKLGAWFNPRLKDSTLTITLHIGTSNKKYSSTTHDLIPGLKTKKWKYSEVVVYLPYIRSVKDSLFITIQNSCSEIVLLDDLNIEFLQMKESSHHDWIPSTYDPVESARHFFTNMDIPLLSCWNNAYTLSSQKSFSGKTSSLITSASPYSVAFEQNMDSIGATDGYIRVNSMISGDKQAEIRLVFDFQNNDKSVYYKSYPIEFSGNSSEWKLSEIFREFPVARFKTNKIKIYYWYIKGTSPVYIDDIQIDIVKYKPVDRFPHSIISGIADSKILLQKCCDFESPCLPESFTIISAPDASSGKNVSRIDAQNPFSFSHIIPLKEIKNKAESFVYVTAKILSDQYTTGANLVVDFKHEGKSLSYHPAYLRWQTIKGLWQFVDFAVQIPKDITSNDTALVYFYTSETDEEFLIDDFCVSLRKSANSSALSKKR